MNMNCMSGLTSDGSLRHSIEVSAWLAVPGAISPSASKTRPSRGWSWRFSPTPGSSWTTSTPISLRCSAGPIPERSRSCGELMAPAETIFSFGRRGLDASGSLILDPGAALAVEGQPSGVGVGMYREVRPVDGGVQVGGCGALALAVSDGQLVPARTLLHRAVEVVGGRVAEFLGRVEEDLRERVRVLCYLGAHGAAGPPVLGVPTLDGLHLLEVWQEALVVPAGRVAGGPAVEVVAVAAQVDHGVDGTRPAEHLAPRPVVREIARPWLGRSLVGPVDFRAPMSRPRGWDVEVLLGILAAGLQQQHLCAVLAQARR